MTGRPTPLGGLFFINTEATDKPPFNGLNHNQGKVTIEFSESYLLVRDQGIKPALNATPEEVTEIQPTSGIGLYIVTLICEHLGWEFSLTAMAEGGTCARAQFLAKDRQPNPKNP